MSGCGCGQGCVGQPCGCCEGVEPLTPSTIYNRPGLDALAYRAGTHGQFFATMQARLSTLTVQGAGADGQTLETWRPLQALTTRDTGDLSIALLDGWATVADILTFYQERIANEGFLRTATERRSVLELASLVGYTLRPGVAASVYLAYTIDERQAERATITAGARSQSSPGPGESPQSFETSEDLEARGQWNNLQVQLRRLSNLTLAFPALPEDSKVSADALVAAMKAARNAFAIDALPVAGTATNLKPGDKLLFTFTDAGALAVVRSVKSVDPAFADQQTMITLQPIEPRLLASTAVLGALVHAAAKAAGGKVDETDAALGILGQTLLGVTTDPTDWITELKRSPGYASIEGLLDQVLALTPPSASSATDPGAIMNGLLKPRGAQVANSLLLPRSLGKSFAANADASPQLMVEFAPGLKDTFYQAWAGATVNVKTGPLEHVYALRARTGLFGASASLLPSFYTDSGSGHVAGQVMPPNAWKEDWTYPEDEQTDNAFLDQSNEVIAPSSYVLTHLQFQTGDPTRQVLRVKSASVAPRSAYGLSGPSTQLLFDQDWRTVDNDGRVTIGELRRTQIYAQSEALTLVDEPIDDDVGGQELRLDGVYDGLEAGRWVILSGERADIPGVTDITAAELMMLSNVSQGFDPDVPGDQVHTTLVLATPTAYRYKRGTLTIYGNVAKATNGETRQEILGSGDGAQSLQSFTLKQPPLTFVAAPNAAGVDSTLRVYVDNVEWHEVDSLAGAPPRRRAFVTATADDGQTTLTFGNGVDGARLPTGVQNVVAVYRSGIGAGGNVRSGQVNLLQTRPLGVTAVVNPLGASGGADEEPRDLARENAPLSVMPLDRLVSIADYADFGRNFAGIAKATAAQVSDGRGQLVYLTIAGADDIPIDPTADLYRNLLLAFRKQGDPDLSVRVDLRELVALVLSAGVKLLPDYQWEPVATAIRARLLDAFGFGKRALGQPALRCEIISAVQGVPGVAYVDIDAFGGVADHATNPDGTRSLQTPGQIAAAVTSIVTTGAGGPGRVERVDAFPGGAQKGALLPAQLAVFSAAVPDTLILNQRP